MARQHRGRMRRRRRSRNTVISAGFVTAPSSRRRCRAWGRSRAQSASSTGAPRLSDEFQRGRGILGTGSTVRSTRWRGGRIGNSTASDCGSGRWRTTSGGIASRRGGAMLPRRLRSSWPSIGASRATIGGRSASACMQRRWAVSGRRCAEMTSRRARVRRASGERLDGSHAFLVVLGLAGVDVLAQIERTLGYHRHLEDEYYGGGEWPVLAGLVGWARCLNGLDAHRSSRGSSRRQKPTERCRSRRESGFGRGAMTGGFPAGGRRPLPLLWSHADVPDPLHGAGRMIHDLWYKNAVVYSLDVETFLDANGDGCGDFEGLSRRLDYLDALGVDAVWLAPFQPSPRRDDGYDIADYYGVDPRFGSGGDFVEFMREARQPRHPRPDRSRRQPHLRSAPVVPTRARSALADPRLVRLVEEAADELPEAVSSSPGEQTQTWTYDRDAREYYFHRFYDFQPDLNMDNPRVREEVRRIMGFWLQLGVAGFRVDAVPFILEEPPRSRSEAHDPLRVPEGVPRVSPVARRRRRAPRGGERPARPDAALLRGRRRAAPDVQLLGEPAPVSQRSRPETPGRSPAALQATREPARRRRSGRTSSATTTSSTSAAFPHRSAAAGVRARSGRSRRCSSTGAGSGAGRRRCSETEAAAARIQPRPLAPRHARDPLRRRDRDGRRPPAQRPGRDPHADAVVDRAQRRLLDGGHARRARRLAWAVRLRDRQRRAATARSAIPCSAG